MAAYIRVPGTHALCLTPFASAAIEDGMLTPTNSVDVSASHVDAGTQDPNSDVEFHYTSPGPAYDSPIHDDDAVPDLDSVSIGLRDPPNESEMELNGTFNTNLTDLDPHFFDEFLANLNSDPYALMFSDSGNVPIAEGQSDDYNYLEYIGPPTEYDTRSAPSQSVVGEFLQGMGSTGEGPIFYSTGLRLSQELPPLPAPPSISPSHTETEDLTVNDMDPEYESEVAPRDINLKLDESNIVPGKRRRTVSSGAAEGEAARSTKRSLFTSLLFNSYFACHRTGN
ncbi:hypothetical protein B0H13DRAFT_1868294 [Mycena leptocephala]|nr:hypothetical protein B0H13DRAFT_1868294 [Mycena leptocephala]